MLPIINTIIFLIKNIRRKANSYYNTLKFRIKKIIPYVFYRNIDFSGYDYFLSGRFHFSNNHSQISKEQQIRIYLTKNQWENYLHSSFSDAQSLVRNRKISDNLKIGFFCSYPNSHFFNHTIKKYANLDSKIHWYLCQFSDFEIYNDHSNIDVVRFKNLDSALEFSNKNFDFIIDADGPLRPTLTSKLLQFTESYVLNYFNLIATSNKKYFDAILIPKNCIPSPAISEKRIIELPALGGWDLQSYEFNFLKNKKYDFGIIAEQFKLGSDFYSNFAFLSYKSTFVFIGMKFPSYVLYNLKKYKWNLKNCTFHQIIEFVSFPKFLKENISTILDIPNYSSGSGTIIGLSVGVPTICKYGEYWINQMAASIMLETKNETYIYKNLNEIEQILKIHKSNLNNNEKLIEKKARQSSYLNPKEFINDFHKALVTNFS